MRRCHLSRAGATGSNDISTLRRQGPAAGTVTERHRIIYQSIAAQLVVVAVMVVLYRMLSLVANSRHNTIVTRLLIA